MKERPILFSTPMVQAILEGRNTQTRRTIKQLPPTVERQYAFYENEKHYWKSGINGVTEFGFRCPYGNPGDILWVRETWQYIDFAGGDNGYVFKASQNGKDWQENSEGWTWRPSIFMPKEACRIYLEVINVRVERLHDISQEDAKAEGFKCLSKDCGRTHKFGIPDSDGLPGVDNTGWPWQDWEVNPAKAFQTLWNKINGNWEENPWVWVIEFKVLSTNGKSE